MTCIYIYIYLIIYIFVYFWKYTQFFLRSNFEVRMEALLNAGHSFIETQLTIHHVKSSLPSLLEMAVQRCSLPGEAVNKKPCYIVNPQSNRYAYWQLLTTAALGFAAW